MIYNLCYIFYSILDLILLKFSTAEIKKNDGFRLIYVFNHFEFIFLYGMRKYSQMKTGSTFFFYICFSNILLGMYPQERRNKSKNKRNGTTSS